MGRVCAKGILVRNYRLEQCLQSYVKHQTDVADLLASEVLEHRYQVEEFVVVRVREPAADGDGVLRMEDVRRGRVVNDDGVLEVAAYLREILKQVLASDAAMISASFSDLYVVALVVVAAFAEESVVDNAVNVELVEKRITVLQSLARLFGTSRQWTYFGNRCGENDNLVQFAHSLHELVHTRSLDDIDIVILAFNLHGNGKVCLVQNLSSNQQTVANTGPGAHTLKLLWTKVSSRSRTRHFFPWNLGAMGPNRYFCSSGASPASGLCSCTATCRSASGGGGGRSTLG